MPRSDSERLTLLLRAVGDPVTAAALDPADPGTAALARHHRLSPLLSAEQARALAPPLAESFRRDRLITAARNLSLAQVAEECVRALDEAAVPTILLKGLEYEARLYAAHGVRPTADIDLLVPDEARRTAFMVLDRLGFEPRAAAPGFDDADYHEVAWTRRGSEVDLHMALAPLARCRIDYPAVWGQAAPLRLGQTETRALAPAHAALFHGLHMAIDHFAVPAIYLIDLARLLPDAAARETARDLAARWRCRRPLETAIALASAFLPDWPGAVRGQPSPIARRVVAGYGTAAPLPRAEQLLRKVAHFDTVGDGLRYLAVQSRRNLREQSERRIRHRSPRERLGLSAPR